MAADLQVGRHSAIPQGSRKACGCGCTIRVWLHESRDTSAIFPSCMAMTQTNVWRMARTRMRRSQQINSVNRTNNMSHVPSCANTPRPTSPAELCDVDGGTGSCSARTRAVARHGSDQRHQATSSLHPDTVCRSDDVRPLCPVRPLCRLRQTVLARLLRPRIRPSRRAVVEPRVERSPDPTSPGSIQLGCGYVIGILLARRVYSTQYSCSV